MKNSTLAIVNIQLFLQERKNEKKKHPRKRQSQMLWKFLRYKARNQLFWKNQVQAFKETK